MLLRQSIMHRSSQCARCEGTGRCPDCNGTGTNRHLNSTDPKCPECSATGVCSECDGSGKSPIAMPLYRGSLLRQGLIWAGMVIAAAWWAASVFNKSRFYAVLVILIWTVFWCVVLYRNAKRHERRKQSATPPRR